MSIIFLGCASSSISEANKSELYSILKIEMKLSAFGVESDDFPSVNAEIDFTKKTSLCQKSYYNPSNKGSTYSLTKKEINTVLDLLENMDLLEMKKEYTVSMTDQPSSTMTIYTSNDTIGVYDYGLQASTQLKTIYKLVYKL